MLRGRSARLFALAMLVTVALAATSQAQESGGSFGGSSWDDEPSGGGSSSGSSGSSGSSDWGGGSSASSDWGSSGGVTSSPQDDEAQRRADEESAREEAAREAEEARAAAEAEAARMAAERTRKLALPPPQRVAELTWPATPPYPAVASPDLVEVGRALPSTASASAGAWSAPTDPPRPEPPLHELRGPWNALSAVLCGGMPTLLFLGAALLVTRRRRVAPPPEPLAPQAGAPGPAMRVSIAFDWTARAQLQSALASMATRFDMRTRPGLSDAARAIVALLDPHAPAARYVSWELSTGDARAWFQNRTNDLRARFRAELVRNDAVTRTPEYRAREDEGQGLVVVTVVVAGKTPIRPPSAAFDLPSLRAAIAAIADRPVGQTLALEVIWSPAAENDRMSSYELEKLYPELQRISEGVGARQCPYCRGPFPAELGKCPSCGAPS